MNPKNPQAAGEGLLAAAKKMRDNYVANCSVGTYVEPDWDKCGTGEQLHWVLQASRQAPAIAPGGDALRLFDDLLYRLAGQIGDSNADFSHKIVSNYYRELDLIRKALAPAGDVRTPMTTDLPAAGNAVDDAMVERAHAAYWASSEVMGDDRPCMRAALTAAIAPAAASGGDDLTIYEGSGCVFCDLNSEHRAPCTAKPADPPAAGGDEQVNAACMSMWGDCFDDSDRKRMRAALLAAQEAAK